MADDALQLSLPARPENVVVVRQAVAGLGEALGFSDQRVDDLKTVVSEACNNVVVHAYGDEPGPLELRADPGANELVVKVSDQGVGFLPQAPNGENASLGLGLPLIASLSDAFEVTGRAGEGTTTTICFSFDEKQRPVPPEEGSELDDALSLEIIPGETARPVIARVIGVLAARAQFSVDKLSDTVLLGDVLSEHDPSDFPKGRVCVSFRDEEGRLSVKVGPLVEGGGGRILEAMDLPAGGSLRALAGAMDVVTEDGGEFLVFEVSNQP